MIKEILIIAVLAAGVFAVFQLYNNNWDFGLAFGGITSTIGDGISQFTTTLQNDPVTALTMIGSGAAICIPFAKLAYDGLKRESVEKIENLDHLVVDKNTELTALKEVNIQEITDLKAKLTEYESMDLDANSLMSTITAKNKELEKAQITIDTLHKTLKLNQLDPDEKIVKTLIG